MTNAKTRFIKNYNWRILKLENFLDLIQVMIGRIRTFKYIRYSIYIYA